MKTAMEEQSKVGFRDNMKGNFLNWTIGWKG